MSYYITKENYSKKINIWVPQLEIAIALLAIQLKKERNLNPNKICKELNFKYCAKKNNKNIKNYNPTKLQKCIINNIGY